MLLLRILLFNLLIQSLVIILGSNLKGDFMKVFTITLGYVEHTEVEAQFEKVALQIGYPGLLMMKDNLKQRIDNASADCPVDLADERELEEVQFMLTFFQDSEGFAKDNIPF
jgi:hypothetical protein